MQPAGMFVMVTSIATVTVLFLWCVWKVLTQPTSEIDRLHGEELITPDVERQRSE